MRAAGLGILLWLAAAAAGCRDSDRPTDAAEVEDHDETQEAHDGGGQDGAANTAEADPAPDAGRVTLTAAGDVLIHRTVATAADQHDDGFRGLLEALGETIAEVAPAPSVSLVNLETPLTEQYVSPFNANPPVLGSPPELAGALAAVGVDLVTVANNHATDQTIAGLVDTVTTARAAGLGVVGAGADAEAALAPWITERGGVRLGFIGVARHVNRGAGGRGAPMVIPLLRHEEPLLAAIGRLREQVEVVVVVVHWSHDFARRPSRPQRSLARRMIEAGADLIIGSGPHVVQEVERLPSARGEALVAYSLGNLISNQGLRYRVGERVHPEAHPVAVTPGTRDNPLLVVRLQVPEAGRVELEAVEAVGLWTVNNFWERRGDDEATVEVRLQRLRDAAPELRSERLEALRQALGEAVTVHP